MTCQVNMTFIARRPASAIRAVQFSMSLSERLKSRLEG
jgi:hypothetical protein